MGLTIWVKLLIVVGGYLLGSVLPAVWIVRLKTGHTPYDVDENPGGAGTYRQAGLWAAACVGLFDVAKGVLPVALAERLGMSGAWLVVAAVSPVVGHNWPLYHRFRGGRGMAAAIGALSWLALPQIWPALVLGALAFLWFRWVPMVGIVAFPIALVLLWLGKVPLDYFWAALVIMLVVGVRQLPWLIEQLRQPRGQETAK
jgi:glycerol-3-phosphate acyltransferase PlsY